jgi:hypothetical protein
MDFLSFGFVSGGITDRNPHAHRFYLSGPDVDQRFGQVG